MDLGAPTSYLALEPGAPVFSRDEQEVGIVSEVRAAEQLDIFDGIVFVGGKPQGRHLIAAEQVEEIFEGGVLLKLTASEALALAGPPR